MNAPRKPLRILVTALLGVCALSVLGLLSCGGEETAPKSEFSLIYYDGHIHTSRSDGTGSVADIKATALARGLSAVIITDHCEDMTADEWESLVAESAAASDASFLVIPAFENTGWESATAPPMRDHFLAYNAPSLYVKDEVCISRQYPSAPNTAGTGPTNPEFLTKWVEWIHSQGGIAVHAHPAGSTQLEYGADLIEIWNQSNVSDVAKAAAGMGYSESEARDLGVMFNNIAIYGERDLAVPVPFKVDGVEQELPFREVIHRLTAEIPPFNVGQWLGSPEAPLRSWDDLLLSYVSGAASRPLFAVAGTDAHNAGGPDSAVGSAKTGVYVKSLSADELYGAIMAGRSFATTGPSVGLDVNGGLMGETIHVTSGGSAKVRLNVKAETAGFSVAEVRIIKNGEAWQTVKPLKDSYEATLDDKAVTEDGYYRIEVTSSDDASNYQYAWSNPVFVKID
jgi:hypothetical protein